ncbi:zinc-binding dehydrogenase [Larkinella soli]|uniref:zinc-binding dehydrogenase n=1 Tax=Larkinella soli TaxID=1770527 RepID=UPI000FFCC278|nr:zinc-binding dehydrogenase [Larkinella soli]
MKAIVLEGEGKPLRLMDMPAPEPGPGDVLIQLKAAAFNRRDWGLQHGSARQPTILGSDGAGVVSAVGEEVPANWVGREVIINPSLNFGESGRAQGPDFQILGIPRHGTFAEMIAIPQEYVHPKPAHLTIEEAAAVPLATLTGYRALFSRGGLQAGERVLLTGIGGGAALAMLQLATTAGAEVYVTSGSDEKIERAKQMGASGGVNYRGADWVHELQTLAGGGFELIVDSAGGPGFAQLIDLAIPGGRIVMFGATRGNLPELTTRTIYWKQLSILGTTMGTAEEFAAMIRFYEQHRLHPTIDEILPLEEAERGIRKMDHSEQFGKIVVKI